MLSGRTIKLILYEALQFAALSVPVLVVMERFASLMSHVKGDVTAYWLVVAASIAYVTSVTLLVWVPLKYLIMKRRSCITEITQWRPTALTYVVLCTLPCFAILIASSKVQIDRNLRYDHFSELPVSLVLFCLICVDVIERIRPCRLTGRVDSLEEDVGMTTGPVLTHLEPVSTVAGQLYPDRGQNGSPRTRNGTAQWADPDSRAAGSAYLYSSPPSSSRSGPLRFLWARDARAEILVHSFLFWMDTAEMVRAAGAPAVFYSGWVFPVYILASLSALRVVIAPHSDLHAAAGFAAQDLPFLVLRIALIVVFGYVTPVLYAVKNLLVCLAYAYFTFLRKWNIFGRGSMF